MTFLVTGGAGFIGSHLVERLLEAGHEVQVIDDLSTGRRSNLSSVLDHPRCRFVEESVVDGLLLPGMVDQADFVIHLAAAVGVRLVVEDPVRTIETNVHGTERVLQLAQRYGAGVLIASTSEVYGKSNQDRFSEASDLLIGPSTLGRWSYACSKLLDEFLGLSYYRQFQLPVVVARLFNTVGPRQIGRYGMVLPRFVNQALRGEPLTVFDDGLQIRCFCHVSDVVGQLQELALREEARGEVFNIGTEEAVTIEELARRVIRATGSRSGIEKISYEQAYGPGYEDMRRRVPALDKLHRLTGYRPAYKLDQIIEETVAFIRREVSGA